MLVQINLPQVAQIVTKTRQYKKLYVSSKGQMFLDEKDAEEAVRTINQITEEPDDYTGLLTITDDMVTNEKVVEFAKDPKKFEELFKDAKIPRTKEKKEQHERKREKVVDDTKELDDVKNLLGLKTKTDETGETKTDETGETKTDETGETKTDETGEKGKKIVKF